MVKHHYLVDGMTCASCSARVTRALESVKGVHKATVNLLRKTALVEVEDENFNEILLFKAVQKAGYGLHNANSNKRKLLKPRTLSTQMCATVVLALTLMLFAFFGLKWTLQPVTVAICEALLSLTVFWINRQHWASGMKALLSLSPTMDSLVAIGSSASYLYSLVAFLLALITETGVTSETLMGLYFDSSAMIYAFVGVGKWLEGRAKDKSVAALEGLARCIPDEATRLVNGKEERVPTATLLKGDILLVRAGEAIPADGKILEGEAEVDESVLTGESLPRMMGVGSDVSCATMVTSGWLQMRVVRAGGQTKFSKILSLVDAVSETKAPIERVADRVSSVFVPFVIFVALVTFGVWISLGRSVEFALVNAVCVLVISCPCALGLATPVAVTIGSTLAARHGVFFKNAQAIEELSRIDTVVFDKTGTLTEGEFEVVEFKARDERKEQAMLAALSIERLSMHPLAKAICRYVKEKGMSPVETQNFEARVGAVAGTVLGKHIEIGNSIALGITEVVASSPLAMQPKIVAGSTRLFLTIDGELVAAIDLADRLRDGVEALIAALEDKKITVMAASGDARPVLQYLKKRLNLAKSYGAMTPEDKQKLISRLKREGHHVLFVGDGINDAPSLVEADVGMAVGAGTDVAVDSADVVLVNNRMADIAACLELSHALMRNIHQNLFWAFFYNLLGIPLAAGFLYPMTGWQLSPMFAAAAMSLSSICVVSNALRLFAWRPEPLYGQDDSEETNLTTQVKEQNMTTYWVRIEGMACEHCAKAVTKAISALSGVTDVCVDLAKKGATVKSTEPLNCEAVKKAVNDAEFDFIDMKEL